MAEFKGRTPKFAVYLYQDRANTEVMTLVGMYATLNVARKKAVARIARESKYADYHADVSRIDSGEAVGTVVYHAKKGAFWITDRTTNFKAIGRVPTAFPISPDGSIMRPVGATTTKKLAKEPEVRAKKKKKGKGKKKGNVTYLPAEFEIE